jgi:hypothetical protein
LKESRGEEHCKAPQTSNQNLVIPDKKMDNSVAKVEAPSRVPSRRARKPIQKTNADFVYTTGKKRKQSNRNKKADENLDIDLPNEDEPLPEDITSEGIHYISVSFIIMSISAA